MSTTKLKITLPKLSQEELEFAENLIALQMPYQNAVESFLENFPGTFDHYEFSEELTQEEINTFTEEDIETEIRRILRQRFRGYRKDKRRLSYHRIKATKETIKSLLDCISIASPFSRLIKLEIMCQDKSLKPEQLIKAIQEATRQVEILIPQQKVSPFPFPGMPGMPGMPDDLLRDKDKEGENQTSAKDETNLKNSLPPI